MCHFRIVQSSTPPPLRPLPEVQARVQNLGMRFAPRCERTGLGLGGRGRISSSRCGAGEQEVPHGDPLQQGGMMPEGRGGAWLELNSPQSPPARALNWYPSPFGESLAGTLRCHKSATRHPHRLAQLPQFAGKS